VPLKVLCDKFSHTRYEPSGFTGNPEIPIAKSISDYIFRWLALKFIPAEDGAPAAAAALPPGAAPAAGSSRASAAMVETKALGPATGTNGAAAHAEGANGAANGTNGASSAGAFTRETDAPPCPTCGSITVRNGACYKCVNCGSTTGCS
jgi:ribonucleoside-diphosphate reductase alpha chain